MTVRYNRHTHISADHRLFDLKLREVWQYRDLVWLFTKRSFLVVYKQTILGPLWLIINPLLTSLVYVALFGNIAKLGTDGIPQMLFNLGGTAAWSFFASCLTGNSSTFTGHAHLFGKVYFPRLVMPVSHVIGAVIRFGIQMIPVAGLMAYYIAKGAVQPHYELWILLPFLLLWLGLLGMGFGILISGMTTKYRDLSVLVGFGMQLLHYGTPVVYPLTTVPESLRVYALMNPVTMPVEIFRYILFGTGRETCADNGSVPGFAQTQKARGIEQNYHWRQRFMRFCCSAKLHKAQQRTCLRLSEHRVRKAPPRRSGAGAFFREEHRSVFCRLCAEPHAGHPRAIEQKASAGRDERASAGGNRREMQTHDKISGSRVSAELTEITSGRKDHAQKRS